MMTETAATSGTSTGSGEEEEATAASVPSGATHRPDQHQPDGVSGAEASGQAAEDTASPAEEAEPPTGPASDPDAGSQRPNSRPGPRPSYTRPPGMPPPPETIDYADQTERHGPTWQVPTTVGVPSSPVLSGPPRPDGSTTSASGSFPVVSASAPVSAPPRVSGRATAGGTTMRPAGQAPDETAGTTRVGEGGRTPRSATTPRGPRRARLGIKRVDPWSVMKFSFAVSLVLFIVVIVAASVLYLALDSMGVFTSVNETIFELVESGGGEGETFRITAQGVIGTAAVLGALNVLLFTSLATLGAFIYNVCADLVGGVEVTLAERE